MKTINAFHSEVGLFTKTFGQLKLSENAEEVKAQVNIKRKSRNNYRAQTINEGPRMSLFNMSNNIPRGALFNMSNNMPNLIQSPKRRRQNNTNNTRKIKRPRLSN